MKRKRLNAFNLSTDSISRNKRKRNHLCYNIIMATIVKSKSELDLAFFDELFRSIWARIVPLLGIVNVRALLEHALEEVHERHPALNSLRVADDGLRLAPLKEAIKSGELKEKEVYTALREYVSSLIHLLAQLTGEVVSRQIIQIVHEKRKKNNIKEEIYE